MSISIEPVISQQQWHDFLSVPNVVYRNIPDYCQELRSETKRTLGKKNPMVLQCQLQCFIAYKDDKPCARAACVINPRINKKQNTRIGLIGYLEFTKDKEVLSLLLTQCEDFFKRLSCTETWIGVNFSLNYPVGIQTSGFDTHHTFLMNKQPSYYSEYLSGLGFYSKKQVNAYKVSLGGHYEPAEDLLIDAERAKKQGYSVRIMKKSDIEDCLLHYNKRWHGNFAHTELTKPELQGLQKDMRLYLDRRFCFVVEKDNQLCGYLFTFPDFNHTLRRWNGKASLFKLLGFLYQYKIKRRIVGLKTAIIGVDERHQGFKLSSLMNIALIQAAQQNHCQYIERSWILEDNHASIKQAVKMGGQLYKTYSVFARSIGQTHELHLSEAI